MKRSNMIMGALAISLVGAAAIATSRPASAAPVSPGMIALKGASPSMVTDVRYRRNRVVGAAVAAGVLGALVGAAAAQDSNYYGPGYYGPGYYNTGYYNTGYYGRNYYRQSYQDGPGYYPGYAYNPGAALAFGMVGAATNAAMGVPVYANPLTRGGRCWIETDPSRGYGYWGWCR